MTAKQKAKQDRQQELRDHWKSVKESLTQSKIDEAMAIMATHGINSSIVSYQICLMAMVDAGLEGIPYLDAKTYNGWKKSGFQVKKGEKSFGSGITWVKVGGKKDEDGEESGGYSFPKSYTLFHRSQVEEINS